MSAFDLFPADSVKEIGGEKITKSALPFINSDYDRMSVWYAKKMLVKARPFQEKKE